MCLTSIDRLLGWSQSLDNGNKAMMKMIAKILLCFSVTFSFWDMHIYTTVVLLEMINYILDIWELFSIDFYKLIIF